MEATDQFTLKVNEYSLRMPATPRLRAFFDQPRTIPADVVDPHLLSFSHFYVLRKIENGDILLPMVDLYSHRDVWIIWALAAHIGFPMGPYGELADSFGAWVNSTGWIQLANPEYLYLLTTITDVQLVDFDLYLRTHKNISGCLELTIALMKERKDPVGLVNAIRFYTEYNYKEAFGEGNAHVRSYLRAIKAHLNSVGPMLDPYDPMMEDYFCYTPQHEKIWACDAFTATPKPEYGAPTLAPLETVRERILAFTFGNIGIGSDNAKGFPLENVIIAGGCIMRILNATYDPTSAKASDVDIFIIAETFEKADATFSNIIDWFENTYPGQVYYALTRSVASVYLKNIDRKFQIISKNGDQPYGVVNTFDTTHIQWALWNGRILGTALAFTALREKTSRIHNLRRIKTHRLVKTLRCGYDLVYSETLADSHPDFIRIHSEPSCEEAGKCIRSLLSWYYPRGDPDLSPADELQHILCSIEKDSRAVSVTNNALFIKSNMVMNGDFDTEYWCSSFTTFNPAHVNWESKDKYTFMRTEKGRIYLASDALEVVSMINGERAVEVTLRPSKEFAAFCNLLEESAVHNTRAKLSKARMIADGKLKVEIVKPPEHSVYVPLRDQRGRQLDLMDELSVGCKVTITFSISMRIAKYADIHLVPHTTTKIVTVTHQDYVDRMKRRAEEEITLRSLEPEHTPEIVYDQPTMPITEPLDMTFDSQ